MKLAIITKPSAHFRRTAFVCLGKAELAFLCILAFCISAAIFYNRAYGQDLLSAPESREEGSSSLQQEVVDDELEQAFPELRPDELEMIDFNEAEALQESIELCSNQERQQITADLELGMVFYYTEDFVEAAISIENKGNALSKDCQFQFLKFDNPFQQIQLELIDENNRQVFNSYIYESWKYDRKEAKDSTSTSASALEQAGLGGAGSPKIIRLALHEGFRFQFDIRAFKEFSHPGMYRVRGFFYPLGIDQGEYKIRLQEKYFELRRASADSRFNEDLLNTEPGNPERPFQNGEEAGLADASSYARGSCYSQEQAERASKNAAVLAEFRGFLPRPRSIYLSPAETAHEHLCAYRQRNFKRYLSFYDLEKILKNSYVATEYYERIQSAAPLERRIILQDFSEYLLSSSTYTLEYFEILQSRSIGDEAEVDVFVSTLDYLQTQKTLFNPVTGQLELDFQSQLEEPILL